MSAESYVKEINSISDELKRLNKRAKYLREQKQKTQTNLYNYMKNHNIERYGDVTKDSLAPKPKSIRKPAAQKKEEAVVLFSQAGVRNPEDLYQRFLQSQKSTENKNISPYNPYLGF